MSIHNNNKKFISYLLILISLFIIVLFIKDEIFMIFENNDKKSHLINKLEIKREEQNKLRDLELSLKNSLDTKKNIEKYQAEIKEDELIDYIYSSIESTDLENRKTFIKGILISDSKDTDLGFKETKIDIRLQISSEEKLKKILNIFISDNSKYKFVIDNFSFPYWNIDNDTFIQIPLKIIHL